MNSPRKSWEVTLASGLTMLTRENPQCTTYHWHIIEAPSQRGEHQDCPLRHIMKHADTVVPKWPLIIRTWKVGVLCDKNNELTDDSIDRYAKDLGLD